MKYLIGFAPALLAVACTQGDLLPVPPTDPGKLDDRLTLVGDFCTTNPDTLRYPVKIMFVVDGSQSLNYIDPPDVNGLNQRFTALTQVFEESILDHDGVEAAVVTYGAATRPLTQRCDVYEPPEDRAGCVDGFTENPKEILEAMGSASLSLGGGLTDYEAVFNVVYTLLFEDMSRLSTEDARAAGNARYVVIFFSDGLGALELGLYDVMCPYDSESCAYRWCPEEYDMWQPRALQCIYYDQIDQITELQRIHDVREVTVHSALLSAGITDPAIRTAARRFMEYIAHVGHGSFRDFENGEDINFLHIDVSSYKRQFKLHNLVITNFNARPWSAAYMIDSDGDGLDDVTERLQGSDIFKVDTDGDGFNDLLEYQLRNSGRDPVDPADAGCDLNIDRADNDNDGLRNCEERVLGSWSARFDSDYDGVPDLIEHRAATYMTLDDLMTDSDFDGAPNGDELRWHTDPHTNDSMKLAEQGYRYRVRQTQVVGNQYCYSYEIENIRLVTTEAPEGGERGWNTIGVYMTEVPLDEPEGIAKFRVGCARARFVGEERFKLPASGEMELLSRELWDPTSTTTTLHCVDPSND